MFINSTQDFIGAFTIFIIGCAVFMFMQNKMNNMTYVRSNVDNKRYLVQNNDDKQNAADMIANINKELLKLVEHLKTAHPNDPRVHRCVNNFIPENVCEAVSKSKHTSYSINKGEKLVICIRSKPDGKIEEFNKLLFVAIHELGHLGSESIGHNDEFWSTFKFFLEEAVKIGIYKPVNYEENPEEYCGIKITDSPIFQK